ncbi:phage major capsid protein [Escherichia albertii]|nr:phage major capsid protein [Escherichia albertii]EFO0110418.1 phage major capsid protein [Escherichia albertii]MLY52164.1 phage major capsid protein [Escherichia albertii]
MSRLLRKKQMELNNQTRAIQAQTISNDGIVSIAFASEFPVQREINGKVYDEVLLCGTDNVDLSRINQYMCPLLIDHDQEKQIGSVLNASIDADRVARAEVSFYDTESYIYDMVKKGMRDGISVGYNILDYYIDGIKLIVTRWMPYEISSVACPADYVGSGINRSLPTINTDVQNEEENQFMDEHNQGTEEEITEPVQEEEVITEPELQEVEEVQEEVITVVEPEEEITEPVLEEESSTEEVIEEPEADDSIRVNEIRSIGSTFNIEESIITTAINTNTSTEEFKEQIRSTEKQNPNVKENKKMDKNLIKAMVEAAKQDREVQFEGAERGINGGFIRNFTGAETTPATGNDLVQQVYADTYIPELLKRSVLVKLNPTVISGLAGRGVLNLPVAKGVTPAFKFYKEGEAVASSVAEFGSMIMSPKIFAGEIPVSKSLILTSPNAEAFVEAELLRHAAVGLESFVFGEVLAKAPVLDSAASGIIDEADLQAAMAKLGTANVDTATCVAVMNSKQVAAFRLQPIAGNHAAIMMVGPQTDAGRTIGGELLVIVSENVPDGSVLIGDFSQLYIAQWSGQEIDMDTTTYRNRALVAYRVWDYLDVALSRPEYFLNLKAKA